MLEIVIRPRARSDIKKIWRYTYDNWGEKQADIYTDALGQAIEEMTENPEMGNSIEHIRKGYGCSSLQASFCYLSIVICHD